jgi:2-phosphosulfolactate phosphatase
LARVKIDLGWGLEGLYELIDAGFDEIVIVDVLRFTTAVDVAVSRGAIVYPYRWHDGTEHAYAAERGVQVAVKRSGDDAEGQLSLSPVDLANIPAGTKFVLPSPNGATLAYEAANHDATLDVIAGCLRNASAVATYLARNAEWIGVVAAGERWNGTTGLLRPAVEDLLGAGAIIHGLDPSGLRGSSPDARAAAGAFALLQDRLEWALLDSPSGRELCARGLEGDVRLAAEHGVSNCVPMIDGDRFVDGWGRSADMRE